MIMLAIETAIKSSLVIAAATVVDRLLFRRASAAWRHLVWTLAVVGLLLLPILSVALPSWGVPIHVDASTASVAPPMPQRSDAATLRDAVPAAGGDLATTTAGTMDASPAASVASVSWLVALPALYAVGVMLNLIRLVLGARSVRRLAKRATALTDPAWTQLLVQCARSLSVRRPVRLLRSLDGTMPMAFGTLRPTILIPSVADTWSDDRRRAVLLHELAHIVRHDCFTQLMAAVTCTLYWVHPGVWWVARRLRVERELACDDRVLAIDSNARKYARHLLNLAYTLGGSRAPALTVSMARPGQIEGRMLAVLDAARDRTIPALASCVAGLAIAVALVIPLAAAEARFVPTERLAGETSPAQSRDAASREAPQVRLPGTWEIRPSDTAGSVTLRLNERMNSSRSSTIAIDQLDGLSPALLAGAGGPVQFNLRRDAGTLAFEGTFRSGIGAGTYTFTPSATFPAELVKRGFARPTTGDQYVLAREAVGFAFLDELVAQAYARPDLAQLVRAAEHGVDFDYLREMGQAGYHLGRIDALVTQRDHGITPRYIREMGALGLTSLSPDDLIRARDHGVDPSYVRELKALGYPLLSLDALVEARDHGIDPEYARNLRQLGYQLTLADLRTARDHGVDAEYVRAMQGFGYAHLSLEELIGARDHGIDPEYVRGMRQIGYELTLTQLIRARDHGVDPEFMRGIIELGYQKLSVDDSIRLRDHGVTPTYVREQNDRRRTRLTIDDLIRLRDGGGESDRSSSGLTRMIDDLCAFVGRWLR
jgi:beta-lactamase regulating signal transducer with metallopeptidase domain